MTAREAKRHYNNHNPSSKSTLAYLNSVPMSSSIPKPTAAVKGSPSGKGRHLTGKSSSNKSTHDHHQHTHNHQVVKVSPLLNPSAKSSPPPQPPSSISPPSSGARDQLDDQQNEPENLVEMNEIKPLSPLNLTKNRIGLVNGSRICVRRSSDSTFMDYGYLERQLIGHHHSQASPANQQGQQQQQQQQKLSYNSNHSFTSRIGVALARNRRSPRKKNNPMDDGYVFPTLFYCFYNPTFKCLPSYFFSSFILNTSIRIMIEISVFFCLHHFIYLSSFFF